MSNGIPITPFKDDKDDTEFEFLMNYLENIKDIEDFRDANRDAFKMEQVYKFNNNSYIDEYDYNLCDEDSDEDEESEHSEEESNNDPTSETNNPFINRG